MDTNTIALRPFEAEPPAIECWSAAHRLLAAKYGIQLRLLQLVQLITRATPVYYEVSSG